MFFSFPEDAHWNAERQAVEFGGEIGEYRGGACFNAYFQYGPPPSGASRRTTFSGPGSRVSPSGSCAGAV